MPRDAPNACCCQPDAVSFANVTDASNCPVALQTFPMCGPFSPAVFQNRRAVICPATSLTTRTPSSHATPLFFCSPGTCVVSNVSDVGGGPELDTVTVTDADAMFPDVSLAIAFSTC